MKIGVLASGNGTNLQAMIDACASGVLHAVVCVVVGNHSRSGAAQRAARHDIPYCHLSGRTHPDPVDLDRAIRPSGYENLDLFPLAKVPPNPAELLESGVFAQLVEKLEARYDRVIFDSPPIMAVTDASILTKFVDGTLIVARQDETNRHMLRQALRSLQTVNARVLGFVLNDVDLNAARRGYYRYRYRYPYYHYSYRYYSRYAEEADGSGDDPKPTKA